MRRTVLLILWIIADVLLFLGAYVAAYFARVGLILSTDFPMDRYLQIALLVLPMWIGVLGFLGVYRLTRVQTATKNISYLFFSCVLAMSLFSLGYYFAYGAFFSRMLLLFAGSFSFVAVAVWHAAFDQWQRRILRKDPPAYPMLVIGANRDAERMIKLLEERQSPFRPVAVLDSRGTPLKDIAGIPVLGKLNTLEDIIKEKGITHLLQCADLEHTINLISVCRQHGITYMLLPMVLGTAGTSEETDMLEGKPVIVINE